jgi:F-type H+-transporting ATPase subunit b
MLTQLGIFVILVALVTRFGLRPVLTMMKNRQDHIEGQIKSAEEDRKKAESYLNEQKELLQQARLEAKEILENARKQKEREAEEIIQKASERAEKMIQEAKAEITREKDKAIASLKNEVGALAIELSTKILQKKIDAKEQSQIVNNYLEQVGRLQ